jgi:asparagine synthase (glutamine-hydrolysing)
MCGIFGFTTTGLQPDHSRSILGKMSELLFHRGPDGEGVYVDETMALGHRRLSIIDLSTGDQPMQDWQHRFVVTFNGEIYNFQELRPRLAKEGFRFQTQSDTEVILAAYAIHGEKCVDLFQGMFAFAVWDKQQKSLFLARDRVGKKPLYYYHDKDKFVFASEMKAILAFPNIERNMDFEALNYYLTYGYIPAPMTIFQGIRKLGEAHYGILKDDSFSERAYWTLPEPLSSRMSESESIEKLESLLGQAVNSRLISDVPLGAFLSGGIDSSAIVAMMAKSGEKVNTFTIDFAEKTHSEIDDANLVAEHCKTDHKTLQVSTQAIDDLPKLAWHFDEPFADSSALPTYYVSKIAREHVTVILSGDGGDELFAGYNSYQNRNEHALLMSLPAGLRRHVIGSIANAMPMQAPMRNLLKYAAYSSKEDGPGALGLYPYIKEDIVTQATSVELNKSDPVQAKRELWANYEKLDKLTRMQLTDTKMYLPGDILVKVDRMSMANSLETRAPLLDYRMVEFAIGLPVNLKMKSGVSKYVLKQVLKNYVPPRIMQKSKQGFAVPIGSWFQTSLAGYTRDILLDSKSRNRGLLKSDVVEKVLQLHSSGRRDYSEWIYMLLMLELWFQSFVDDSTRRI